MIEVNLQNKVTVNVGVIGIPVTKVGTGVTTVVGKGGIDVSGASVGQIIKIASVDEFGRPIAWEAEDLPDGTENSIGAVEALETLSDCGMITPAYYNGVFYTDADGAIYVL